MWSIIILFAVGFVYFNFFYKKTKSNNSRQQIRSTNSKRQNSEGKKPEVDWVFKREIDQQGVPIAINSYRRVLNGCDYKMIVRNLKAIAKINDEVQRNLAYLAYIEPLAELERKGCFDMNEDMPNLFFEYFFHEIFTFLNEYYPVIGAKGQMENLEDICKYVPELKGYPGLIAYGELQLRDELLQIIKKNGFIYGKDLKKIERFNNYSLNRYLIFRLLKYNIIEKGKDGRLITYKLKI